MIPTPPTSDTNLPSGKRTLAVSFWQKVVFWGTLGVAVLYFLKAVSTILIPFIVGFFLAYCLAPVVGRLNKRGMSRAGGALILIILIVALLICSIMITWPLVQKQLIDISLQLPLYGKFLQHQLIQELDHISQLIGTDEWDKLRLHASTHINAIISWFGTMLFGFVTNGVALINFIIVVTITPIVAFYMLRDWPNILKHITNFVPLEYRHIVRKQVILMDRSLREYAKGQATVSLILALYYGIALGLSGLRFGMVIGFLTGLFAFIPFLAMIMGYAVACVIALYQTPSDMTLLILVSSIFAVGQAMEGYVLTPNLIGNRIGLHPVWIIFVVLSGAALFGIWGALLALPAASVISVLFRFALGVYYQSPFHTRPPLVKPSRTQRSG